MFSSYNFPVEKGNNSWKRYNFRIKVRKVQMVFLAISSKMQKHSAYPNEVHKELHMAAMVLMDEDKIENICWRPHKYDLCTVWF